MPEAIHKVERATARDWKVCENGSVFVFFPHYACCDIVGFKNGKVATLSILPSQLHIIFHEALRNFLNIDFWTISSQ